MRGPENAANRVAGHRVEHDDREHALGHGHSHPGGNRLDHGPKTTPHDEQAHHAGQQIPAVADRAATAGIVRSDQLGNQASIAMPRIITSVAAASWSAAAFFRLPVGRTT